MLLYQFGEQFFQPLTLFSLFKLLFELLLYLLAGFLPGFAQTELFGKLVVEFGENLLLDSLYLYLDVDLADLFALLVVYG